MWQKLTNLFFYSLIRRIIRRAAIDIISDNMSSRKDVSFTRRRCPFCGGNIAIDHRQSRMVCSECGMVIKEEDFEMNVIKKRDPKTNKVLDDGYPVDRDWKLRQKIKKAYKH
jgi:ribosomal protein S27AE